MNTGSSSQTNFTYDQSLRPTSYKLTAGTASYTWNYQYSADGNVRMVSDVANDHFDKAFAYDHAGRMIEAYSGREARGLQPASPTPDSPYRQSFAYNAFNQHVRETGRIWQRPLSGQTFTYLNNRRQDLLYDAEGHVIADAQGSHIFDAAGERSLATAGEVGGGETGHPLKPAEEGSMTHDADGRPGKSISITRTETLVGLGPQTSLAENTETIYYLRSTVLGGYVVGELDAQGQKRKQYIYAAGERLAEHWTNNGSHTINWQHRNPLTDSWISVDARSLFSFRTEVDAHSRETGLEPPTILPNEPPPPPTRSPSYLEMQGGPTLEAELGQQFYEEVYVNKIFESGNGPGQGGYDRLRIILEAHLQAGGTFLLGLDRLNALASPGQYEEVIDFVKPGLEEGEQGEMIRSFRLKPGSRRSSVGGNSFAKAQEFRGGLGGFVGEETARQDSNCLTITKLLANSRVTGAFEAAWEATKKSGKENGGWVFNDENYPTDVFVHQAPEGTEDYMKGEPEAFEALLKALPRSRPRRFILDYHTHKFNPSPGSDIWVRDSHLKRGSIGVIVYKNQYTFYTANNIISPSEYNNCL